MSQIGRFSVLQNGSHSVYRVAMLVLNNYLDSMICVTMVKGYFMRMLDLASIRTLPPCLECNDRTAQFSTLFIVCKNFNLDFLFGRKIG